MCGLPDNCLLPEKLWIVYVAYLPCLNSYLLWFMARKHSFLLKFWKLYAWKLIGPKKLVHLSIYQKLVGNEIVNKQFWHYFQTSVHKKCYLPVHFYANCQYFMLLKFVAFGTSFTHWLFFFFCRYSTKWKRTTLCSKTSAVLHFVRLCDGSAKWPQIQGSQKRGT